jgi:hypothetical protein
MVQKTKNNSLTEFITEIIKENEEFLKKEAKETFNEVIELINDAIDYVAFVVERKTAKEDYVKHPMFFFIYHVLMPFSYGIYADLLLGNLPVCFIELRLIVESLAKCYIAESYSDKEFL